MLRELTALEGVTQLEGWIVRVFEAPGASDINPVRMNLVVSDRHFKDSPCGVKNMPVLQFDP